MVHVNLPPGADAADHPERRAGQISMFGVAEASRGDERHGGGGLTFSFEITSIARGLEDAGEWNPDRLRVTFTPTRRRGMDVETGPRDGGVSAGRVSLFYT
jgi:tyrosinase